MNLSKEIKITKIKAAAVAAGTEVVSDTIDMAGFDGVLIVGAIATANAGNYLKAQQDSDANMTTAADIEGSKVVAAANGDAVYLDIYRPLKRYITANVIRAGANTATGEIYALQYSSRSKAVANTMLGKLLISPDNGTA